MGLFKRKPLLPALSETYTKEVIDSEFISEMATLLERANEVMKYTPEEYRVLQGLLSHAFHVGFHSAVVRLMDDDRIKY